MCALLQAICPKEGITCTKKWDAAHPSTPLRFFKGRNPKVHASEEAIMKYLDSLPTSTFGWHNVDLRNPLPDDVSALDTPHPIGVHNGRKAFLCSRSAAIHFAKAELSEIFTEHYKGEKVYIGYEYIGYEKA